MSLINRDSISIITPVIVKSIVTEKLIESIRSRISDSLDSLNDRLSQVEYQKEFISMQSKQKDISNQAIENIKKAENEIRLQINKIEDQSKQVDSWKLGQEVIMTQKESIKEYSLGDVFIDNNMSEIVVKDGKIVEIRE